jgi:predicted small secreted protein
MKKLLCVIVFVLSTFGLTGCGIGDSIGNDIEEVMAGIMDAVVASDNSNGSNDNASSNYLFKGADIFSCVYKGTNCTESEHCAVMASLGKVGVIECKDILDTTKFAGTIKNCYFAGKTCIPNEYCVTEVQVSNVGIIDCSI